MNRAAIPMCAPTLALMLATAVALPAAHGDALDGLDGAAIVHAGSFSEKDCPGGGQYDCSTWPQFFTQADSENLCFSLQIPVCDLVCNGMLVVDRTKQLRFITFSGIGSSPQSSPVTMYNCPD